MCIRDRFGVSTLKELSLNMKKPSLEEIDDEGVTGFHKQLIAQFGGKCAISEESVSYTHLDVYKRQSISYAKWASTLIL